MKVRAVVPFLTLAVAFAVASQVAGEDAHSKAPEHSGLDRFKALAGDWVGKMTMDGKNWHDATAKYSVTSGGHVVVETLGPGSPHEMVTVIHQDGKELALTHYCAIGNQPHMKAEDKAGGNSFEFHFAGCSNMKSDKDMHMHDVVYTFPDKDTLLAVWTNYKDGKKGETATFELKRKK
jgi:hypothetical protein